MLRKFLHGLFLLGMMEMSTVSAQPSGRDPMVFFATDKNGSVSLKELKVRRPEVTEDQFAQWDKDHSGELDQEELTRAIIELLETGGRRP